MKLLRKKPLVTNQHHETGLKRCLTAFDLTLLGIGATIGAGIFVLTGIAAAISAGPAIMLSFLLAGIACAFSALCYAELASCIGGAGSVYNYAYVGFGEILAWIVGWNLLLEYSVACSTVAIGWCGYIANLFSAMGLTLPHMLLHGPLEGGLINLPAMLIILLIAVVLSIGARESARLNAWMVFIKIAIIIIFVGVAVFHVNTAHWKPFLPFGWTGIVSGAAFVFFAYVGFDAIATAAEEAVNPQRDLPIAIIMSLAVCALVYITVSGLLTGIASYTLLNVSSPVSTALLNVGERFMASLIAVGAVVGLTTVILVMFYGLTRIFFAMARDGLLPNKFASLNVSTQTPLRIIWTCAIIMALVAGFVPIEKTAAIVNITALASFTLACLGVIVLRRIRSDISRPFKTPFLPWLPLMGAILNIYLMIHLSKFIWAIFLGWTMFGLSLYFLYGRYKSLLLEQSAVQ